MSTDYHGTPREHQHSASACSYPAGCTGCDSILVYLDSDSDRAIPLYANVIDGTWNGWAVPVVTAAEFERWLAAMIANDSAWEESTTWATSFALFYSDENGLQEWSTVGETDDDDNDTRIELYAIDGWTWTL